ncbi:MAG: phospho-sugar mutase, partial [Candidatus Sumerlaeota bacterium]|nr:phospho-sugar mutase [Candidatus Sumerlaeota bacterium]
MPDSSELKSILKALDLDKFVRQTIAGWLDLKLEPELRAELEALIAGRRAGELNERFSQTIEFGTGGMRGPMGVGTNRINHVMIGRATQGLADYMKETLGAGAAGPLSAVVCYDPRINSVEFARETATTLAANGIRTHLFRALRPTPELSFAVRQLKASAGVMITASHNPKEDNGYKVYWTDGAQIIPPHDDAIVERVKSIAADAIRTMDFDRAVNEGRIVWVGEEMDEAFLQAVLTQRTAAEAVDACGATLKIVYTALHGTGGTMAPEALRRWGFANVELTPSQKDPDGRFPTVKSANPEDPKAFVEALEHARRVGADLVLATDPDCDRAAAAVPDGRGGYRILSGNETGAMLVWHLLSQRKAKGRLPANPVFVKTIVTTELAAQICREFGVELRDVLTGFKWIGEQIRFCEESGAGGAPKKNFVFGFEESIGYLAGDYTRDKDGVVGVCLIAEMAAWAMARGQTLLDLLDDIHARYGIYCDSQTSIYRTGSGGQKEIAALMEALRSHPPKSVGGAAVERIMDVEKNVILDCASGKTMGATGLPRSNVLTLHLAGGGKIVAR